MIENGRAPPLHSFGDTCVGFCTAINASLHHCITNPLADGDGSETAWRAAEQLARLLTTMGKTPILRKRAEAGNPYAARALGENARTRDEVLEVIGFLRTAARHGDSRAAFLLVELLAEQADVAGLRTEAEQGTGRAAFRLAEMLAARDDVAGVTALATDERTTSTGTRYILFTLLARLDRFEVLSAWADYNHTAAQTLADAYAAQGAVDALRARVKKGDRWAQRALVDILAARGDEDGLRAQLLAGSTRAQKLLLALVTKRNPAASNLLRRFGLEPDPLVRTGSAARTEDVVEELYMQFTPVIFRDPREWLNRMREVDAGRNTEALPDA